MSYPPSPNFTSAQPPTAGPQGANLGALGVDGTEQKPPKRATKKVVNRQILIAGVFAVAIALVAAFLLLGSGGGTFVVVANSNIPAATPLKSDMLSIVQVPPTDVVEGAISGTSQAAVQEALNQSLQGNPRVNQNVPGKAQLSTTMLGPDRYLITPLGPDERLISTSATVSRALAGQISAGDSVDVVGTMNGVSSIIAANVPVIAATVSEDQYSQDANSSNNTNNKEAGGLPSGVPGIYVLRVKSDDAVKIIAARENGQINLIYRGPTVPSQ